MTTSQIITVFLDRNLNVRRYTPGAEDFFDTWPVEVGDSLSTLARGFETDGLLLDAQTVLETCEPTEREFHHEEKCYLAQVRPYRTVGDRIDGVILTFVDISERHELEQKILSVYEEERRRVARDLHEELSSELAVLSIKVENLKRRLEAKGVEEAEALEGIAEMARRGNDRARSLSHELVPTALQEEHLAASLETLCREEEEGTGLDFTFTGDWEEPLPVNTETAAHLYRIAREALSLAVKNPDVNSISTHLRRRENMLVMCISDDGTGFPSSISEEVDLGLRAMRYRANLVGASLTIENSEDEGTTVECELPLSKARANGRSLGRVAST